MFDIDDTGYITKDNLVKVFERLGKNISENDIEGMIKEADFGKDGMVSFSEFKLMMEGSN